MICFSSLGSLSSHVQTRPPIGSTGSDGGRRWRPRLQACVYMCFFNLFRAETQGSAGAGKPVSCVTRTRRWPADMVASFEDPQTNQRFKGHFKRRSADGAWKRKTSCLLLFPTCNHSVWSRSLFRFCDAWKCCARICKKAQRRVQTVTRVKTENGLQGRAYTITHRLPFIQINDTCVI